VSDRRRCELWDAATAAAVDRHSISGLGIPSAILMERAALACSYEAVALREGSTLPVWVLCGPGNNGGDGVALARQLHGWGVPVRLVLASSTQNAALGEQLAIARACGVIEGELAALPESAVVIDALLGTGSRGAPRGEIAAALARALAVTGPRLAIDVPSGIDPDLGTASTDAFTADVTVSFGRSKPGLHVTPGRGHAGRVVVADIGLVATQATHAVAMLIDPDRMAELLEAQAPARHKGERGHVGIIGGAARTPGAVLLAASASFRAGAGLCTVGSDDATLRAELLAARPELMFASPGALAVDALVVGPGLTDPASNAGLAALWRDAPCPSVWDASALDHVPAGGATAARVITPHPGEAARMLARLDPAGGWTSAGVQASRLAAARALVAHTGAIVVLKGEGTIVAAGDRIAIDTLGNAALATAGSGDVLAGILAAGLARGLAPEQAAAIAVSLHGAAGRVVATRHRGSMAGDLVEALDEARTQLRVADTLPRWRSA
jgi:ADP-dependent NAD(P)H-hydrate dehydratase / NAD(P)H-hydrate epimerase